MLREETYEDEKKDHCAAAGGPAGSGADRLQGCPEGHRAQGDGHLGRGAGGGHHPLGRADERPADHSGDRRPLCQVCRGHGRRLPVRRVQRHLEPQHRLFHRAHRQPEHHGLRHRRGHPEIQGGTVEKGGWRRRVCAGQHLLYPYRRHQLPLHCFRAGPGGTVPCDHLL